VDRKSYPLRALCDRVGIDRRALESAIASGAISEHLITSTSGGHRKVLDLDAAEAELRAFLDGGAGDAPGALDLDRWKAHREKYGALREELKYRQELGELISHADAERQVRGAFVLVRQRIEQIPSQLAADLAAMTESFDVEEALRAAVRSALAELSVKIGDDEIRDDEDGGPADGSS
jgi:hypothetical protein